MQGVSALIIWGGKCTGLVTKRVRLRGGAFLDNLQVNEVSALLCDVEAYDFRPRGDSILVDRGRVVEGLTTEYHGKAPDIGAYEQGAPRWVPGITWDPMTVLGFEPVGYLSVL